MKLRDNFPNTKEEAHKLNVEWRDVKGIFKIYEPKDPTSLISIEESINEISDFLVKNGYDPIPNKKFIDNDFYYESPDEIVSLNKHGYIEAFMLFIEREAVDVVVICKKVLDRLNLMDYEKDNGESEERLIFPNKIQATGNIKRVSEQELRFLFIEEFKIKYPELYYSIETPTEEKYKFGNNYEDIVKNAYIHKTSASIDMCVLGRKNDIYKRLLNIEFKHKNTKDKNIGKDILKLVREKQNGVFIHLLNNTRKGRFKGTLWNENNTGVFNKLYKSFNDFKNYWNGEKEYIQLIILSLEKKKKGKPFLIHRTIKKKDLGDPDFFSIDNIKSVTVSKEPLDDEWER